MQKNRIRSVLRRGRLAFVKKFRSYSAFDLTEKLRKLGLSAGDSVMVHCSFGDEFGFNGSIDDFINALLQVVGPSGNLLMVSMPYTGAASDYLGKGKVFDTRRTPSAMGLVSESFRRKPNVFRSSNPMHPVLAFGPAAQDIVADHESCMHSCGPGSPFGRLLDISGKVLFINASLSHFTFFHFFEHRIRHRLSFPLYTNQAFEVPVINMQGDRISVRVFGYSQEAIARRDDRILHKWLWSRRVVRSGRLGATTMLLLDLRETVIAFDEMTASGRFFYK